MGGPSTEHNARDLRAAPRARFAFAIVHLVRARESAHLSFGAYVVANGAASLTDGFPEYAEDLVPQRARLPYTRGRRSRMNAGGEERFVGVDISHAGHHSLVKK